MRWIGRIAKWLGLGFLTLIAAGAIYQQIGTALDARLAPPPGEMVQVRGRAVHLVCAGQGPRTFVLDAGLGAGAFEFWRLQPLLARTGRACAFDRAGLGWSAPSAGAPDGATAADELAELVRAAKIPTPFVYVGHSLGANIAMIYYARHRRDVAALVLIEPGDPKDLLEDFHGTRADADRIPACDWTCYGAGAAAYLGIPRLAAGIAITGGKNLAGQALGDYRAGLGRPATVMTMMASLNAVPRTAFEDLAIHSFADTPVLTFASSKPRDPEGHETADDVRKWRIGQMAYLASLAAKSTRGAGPIVIPDSSHASMVMGEAQSRFMATAIADFLTRQAINATRRP